MGLELKITTELPGFSLDVSWSIQDELVVLFGHSGLPEEVFNNPVNNGVGSLTDLKNLYPGCLFA